VRIVLSRKGFDASSGGVASPILPDGRLVSLPIPARDAPVPYRDVRVNGEALGPLVEELSRGRVRAGDRAHLDPDLDRAALPRLPGWRAAFGQLGAAQAHLAARGVGPGDLFLFFGWFREVERARGGLRPRRGAPDLHVLFGWLAVGEVLHVGEGAGAIVARRPWLASHPHAHLGRATGNTIYVAADRLHVPGGPRDGLPGAGLFRTVSEALVLTQDGQPMRSVWRLPPALEPRSGGATLSYHADAGRWTRDGDGAVLRTVGRGQEFVLDCARRPEAIRWALGLVRHARAARPPRRHATAASAVASATPPT
jgi:hypothetical protein